MHFLLFLLVILTLPGISWAADSATPQVEANHESQSSDEALQAIANRMKSLAGSLEQLPAPPRMDQKIDLPVIDPSTLAPAPDTEKK